MDGFILVWGGLFIFVLYNKEFAKRNVHKVQYFIVRMNDEKIIILVKVWLIDGYVYIIC
jgi:hypothetical protein